MDRIYLDGNASTPLDPRVREAMLPWLDCGNASSPHHEGRAARAAIDRAREQVAALIGARPRDLVFTSGATEANALALLGSLRAAGIRRAACSAVEHPSVLRTLEALPGLDLHRLPVDAWGRVAPDAPVPEGAGLLSVMLANNETGTVQPVAELAAAAHARGAIVHTDAVQACGKMRVDVDALGVDLLSLSAHKMHGPKGAGALWARRGARPAPLYAGGEHEGGARPGTENVAAIVGFGAAAELAVAELDARRARWARLRGRIVAALGGVGGLRVRSPEDALPNTLCLGFDDLEGEAALLGLDLAGIAVATGSACSSGAMEPSHVLLAMGCTRTEAARSLRVSMHAATTEADADGFVNNLRAVVKRFRAVSGTRGCAALVDEPREFS